MSFLLDSDVCIAAMSGKEPKLLEHLARQQPADLVVSTISRAELFYGAHHSARVQSNLERLATFLGPLGVLDFDEASAEAYGRIRAELKRRGTPIRGNDLLLAAQARAHGHIVVTRNGREFERVDGLQVERW